LQVGSHYAFLETNPHLSFPRLLTFRHALRLDIAAGTAVRFEPGESKTVQLVSISGNMSYSGGSGLGFGLSLDAVGEKEVVKRLQVGGFKTVSEEAGDVREVHEAREIDREVVSARRLPTSNEGGMFSFALALLVSCMPRGSPTVRLYVWTYHGRPSPAG
jgi:urease